MATTRLQDLIVPEVYEGYQTDEITRKLNLIQSGTVARSEKLDSLLNGGGATFNFPFYNNLSNSGETIATDNPADVIVPEKASASNLVVARCVRTASWEVADIDEMLTADDPMAFISSRTLDFRLGCLQKQFMSVVKGVFANNATASDDYHTQNDQRWVVSGTTYSAGVTDFNVNHLIDAISLMGDAQDGFGMIMVHPTVFANMQKQDIIDTRIPSGASAPVRYYNGYQIILNQDLPNTGGVYSTYIFGRDQFKLGFGSVKEPIAFEKHQAQGNGYGVTTMYNRWCNAIAPKGYSYIGSGFAVGGPANDTTNGALSTATSWRRVCGDKRSVKMVELVTRETA